MSFNAQQFSFRSLAAIYAERTQPIIFFVGAGLSVPAGMPDWQGLRDHLISVGESKFATFELNQRIKKLSDLRAIKRIPSYWTQFSRLEQLIGLATFRQAVIEKFSKSTNLPVPRLYEDIWNLRTRGIITLNLDIFARRAFASQHKHFDLTQLVPHDVGQKSHILKNTKQHFVAFLHGTFDDVSSWVLTDDGLIRTLNDPAYLNFVSSIFTTHVVVFIGVGATDVTAGGIIGRLTEKGIDPGNHYWITSSSDLEADEWAERNGILIIRYSAESGHDTPLNELMKYLAEFKSFDEVLSPRITRNYGVSNTLESPDDLEHESHNSIRLKINAYAAQLNKDLYSNFLKVYRPTLHKAWYVDVNPPYNEFFDYRIVDRIGGGLFGTVYKAEAKDGTLRAVKILKSEIMEDESMLQGFRRGASSMEILSRAGVRGVARFYEAFELPPAIVMEFVEGGNLEQAKAASLLDGWTEIMAICRDVAQIVKDGHLLPQRVLHRDIRPANIMLRSLYTSDLREVVVLDFDLSWHLGAIGHTIAPHAMQAMGYLSPEQRQGGSGATTRNATVDTFGLAMTMYHLLTGLHPGLGEHRDPRWETIVYSRLPKGGLGNWESVRRRMARLIASGTSVEQNRRLDMGEVYFELSRMYDCLVNPETIQSAELIGEEIAFEAFEGRYDFDDEQTSIRKRLASGAEFVLRPVDADRTIELTVTFAAMGHEGRKNIGKYLPEACEKAKKFLRENGWEIKFESVSHNSARISSTASSDSSRSVKKQWGKMLHQIESLYAFD